MFPTAKRQFKLNGPLGANPPFPPKKEIKYMEIHTKRTLQNVRGEVCYSYMPKILDSHQKNTMLCFNSWVKKIGSDFFSDPVEVLVTLYSARDVPKTNKKRPADLHIQSVAWKHAQRQAS